jgi:hypothetical protein
LFWNVARARTKAAFDIALEALSNEKPVAAQYLDEIKHALWARYAFPTFRFGHDTSNIIKSLNSA